jgi:two-component system cell cycle sensor histidine kinase PleC
MLRQMLFNLIGNAVKFTEPGGKVAVSAGNAGGKAVDIVVADTGAGMDETQIASALSDIGGGRNPAIRQHPRCGAGIGLPLTRKLAEVHGGALHLSSVAGTGTVATLRLPGGLGEGGAQRRTATAR